MGTVFEQLLSSMPLTYEIYGQERPGASVVTYASSTGDLERKTPRLAGAYLGRQQSAKKTSAQNRALRSNTRMSAHRRSSRILRRRSIGCVNRP